MIYNVLFIQKDGVGMAGNWDFTADSDIQTELSSKLNEAADKYDAKVEAMYKEIESLGSNSYWVGEDYDAFKTGTEGYKTALKNLSDGIRMYGAHFETMATGTDTLASELIAIIQNMTGSGNGGGTSSNGTSGNSAGDSDDYIGGTQAAIIGGDAGDDSSGGSSGQNGTTSQGGSSSQNESEKDNTEALPESGDGTNIDIEDGNITEKSAASVVFKSGDSVKINGQDYNVYGSVQKPNGEVVSMYADNAGNLYYQNSDESFSNVKATYMDGNGKIQSENATVSSLGTVKNLTAHGSPYSASVSLEVDGMKISSVDSVASSVTYTGVDNLPVSNGSNAGSYINNDVSISTDGTLKTSYKGQIDGSDVNGSKVITATSMDDFSSYVQTQNGADITLKIPEGQYVQWDSPSGGTGYVFNTDKGAAYLRWNSDANGYQIVDEYGNVTNERVFTLDGFNDDGGINGGVWK